MSKAMLAYACINLISPQHESNILTLLWCYDANGDRREFQQEQSHSDSPAQPPVLRFGSSSCWISQCSELDICAEQTVATLCFAADGMHDEKEKRQAPLN